MQAIYIKLNKKSFLEYEKGLQYIKLNIFRWFSISFVTDTYALILMSAYPYIRVICIIENDTVILLFFILVVISIIFILDIHPIKKNYDMTVTRHSSSLLAHKKNWMPRTNQNGAYFILRFIQGHEKSPTYNEPLLKICCLGSRWLDAPAGTF